MPQPVLPLSSIIRLAPLALAAAAVLAGSITPIEAQAPATAPAPAAAPRTPSASPTSAQPPSAAPNATRATPATTRPPRGGARDAAQERWWNDPAKVAALGLTTAQRTKADALAQGFVDKARESAREEINAARESLADALAANNAAKARASVEAMGEVRNRSYRHQVELMIAVVALLDSSQRAKLAADYPELLREPWVRQARPTGPGSRSPRRPSS